jgi:hypothetical protein
VTQLQDGIAFSAFVTPQELERARALQEEQREVAWFVIPASRYAAQNAPDEAAVSAYYEQNKSSYVTPETLTMKYVELQVSDLLSQVTVTDAELQEHYESIKDRFIEQEKRRGRHILLQVSNDSEDAAARKRAEEVLAKVNAGGDFAKLAREYSQDAGSAAEGGDLGWAERSFFVGPFADALFAMVAVRGPCARSSVTTSSGWMRSGPGGRVRGRSPARDGLPASSGRDLFGERQGRWRPRRSKLDSLDMIAAVGLTSVVVGFIVRGWWSIRHPAGHQAAFETPQWPEQPADRARARPRGRVARRPAGPGGAETARSGARRDRSGDREAARRGARP